MSDPFAGTTKEDFATLREYILDELKEAQEKVYECQIKLKILESAEKHELGE